MSRKTEKRELNTWYDDLLWCPSQCYYYFMHGCDMFCIYLRWRHQNPWTVEIIKCEEDDTSLSPDTSTWKWVSVPYFEDFELAKLKEYVMARLDIILALWPHCENRVSLRIEEYKTLPSDIRNEVIEQTQKLLEDCQPNIRKIRTTHAGEVKAFETLLRMEVRDYLAKHEDGPVAGDGLYISPDTANITPTNVTAVTDHSNFYPFSSLVRFDRKDGNYDVDKDITGNVAFNYYAFGTSRDDVCSQEGHDYRYNSTPSSLPPTKCICAWCHKKWQADYSGDIIHGEIWHEVDSFQNETRSDEELIASWFK